MPGDFLPITKKDMQKRGWDGLDILFISADAYVDHPSFACALLGRLLEKNGYRVGIIAQPDWKDPESLKVMGKPRLCCMVSGGNRADTHARGRIRSLTTSSDATL